MIKAFIMAAGVGERLKPLTSVIPKPMVPVVNKPVIQHTLELLRKNGFSEIFINLYYRPEMIMKYLGSGKKWDLSIGYSVEKKLLGTAGGVRKMSSMFKDYFIVMSGDGITDIDLNRLLKFHIDKKAFATMVLKEVDSKFDYGVTLTDKTLRIKKFIEKPSWSEVFSNTVNTGIYVFSPEVFKYIPKDKFWDFGHDVWPLLLKKGERIYGYKTGEYWCDIGNLTEYRRAQKDALDGNIRLEIPGRLVKKNIWIGSLTKISKNVVLKSPCVIGDSCIIGDNAVIGPYTVIAGHSEIMQGAVIENSILWGRARVERKVRLRNCIIGYKGVIKESVSIFEGSVLNIQE